MGKSSTAVSCGFFFLLMGDSVGGLGPMRKTVGVVAAADGCVWDWGLPYVLFLFLLSVFLDFVGCFVGVEGGLGFPLFTPPRFTPLLLPVLFLVFRVFLVALPPFFVRLRRRPHFAVRFICIHIVRKNKTATWDRTHPSKARQGRLAR
jgi:hypothetical protein